MKVYLSGPMTGRPDCNREAFKQGAAALKELFYEVVVPHDVTEGLPSDATWADYMREDIKAMMDCEAIVMLPEWETSKGARVELSLAFDLGMPVLFLDDLV